MGERLFEGKMFSEGIKPGLLAPPPNKTKADHEDDSKIFRSEKKDNRHTYNRDHN